MKVRTAVVACTENPLCELATIGTETQNVAALPLVYSPHVASS